jgi:hypothetical protein
MLEQEFFSFGLILHLFHNVEGSRTLELLMNNYSQIECESSHDESAGQAEVMHRW